MWLEVWVEMRYEPRKACVLFSRQISPLIFYNTLPPIYPNLIEVRVREEAGPSVTLIG